MADNIKTGLVTLEEFEYEDPIPIPQTLRRPIAVRPMVLMGSGPTNPTQRVTEALCKPIMGLFTHEFEQVRYLLFFSLNLYGKPECFWSFCKSIERQD